MQELWNTRNLYKYEDKIPNVKNIKTNINNNIRHVIEIHYKKYKNNSKLEDFKELFCINNQICKIEKNELSYLLG